MVTAPRRALEATASRTTSPTSGRWWTAWASVTCSSWATQPAGRYAWSYAVANPALVRALVVVDIDPDRHNPQTDRDFADIAAEPDTWNTLDDFAERVAARQIYTKDDVLRRHASVLSKRAPGGGYTWKADIRTITEYERPDLWDSWSRITRPVLLVRGRQSALLTHETAVRMRELLPVSQVRLAELEGGGHWFYQDFPEAFEAAVQWFLADIAAPGTGAR